MRDHYDSRTTSRAVLSGRMPRSRGWRILPLDVHSMNATCTTTSGLTQQTFAGKVGGDREGGLRDEERLETTAQIGKELHVKAGADPAGVQKSSPS